MRISPTGRVTLPAGIRRQLGLLPGTEVEFAVEGNRLVIQKVGRPPKTGALIKRLAGKATANMSTDEILRLTRGD